MSIEEDEITLSACSFVSNTQGHPSFTEKKSKGTVYM